MLPKTIFLDIDGCLLNQTTPVAILASMKPSPEPDVLPGVIQKIVEWTNKGYKIIITTGRKACFRKFTMWQLQKAGIPYDRLLMNVGCGPRVVINDLKPNLEEPMALAFNLPRNTGLESVEI